VRITWSSWTTTRASGRGIIRVSKLMPGYMGPLPRHPGYFVFFRARLIDVVTQERSEQRVFTKVRTTTPGAHPLGRETLTRWAV